MSNTVQTKSLPFTTIMALQDLIEGQGATRAQSSDAVNLIEKHPAVQKALFFSPPDPRDVASAVWSAALAIEDNALQKIALKAVNNEGARTTIMAASVVNEKGMPSGLAALVLGLGR